MWHRPAPSVLHNRSLQLCGCTCPAPCASTGAGLAVASIGRCGRGGTVARHAGGTRPTLPSCSCGGGQSGNRRPQLRGHRVGRRRGWDPGPPWPPLQGCEYRACANASGGGRRGPGVPPWGWRQWLRGCRGRPCLGEQELQWSRGQMGGLLPLSSAPHHRPGPGSGGRRRRCSGGHSHDPAAGDYGAADAGGGSKSCDAASGVAAAGSGVARGSRGRA